MEAMAHGLREKQKALEEAVDEAKAIKAAAFELRNETRVEDVIAHALHVAHVTFAPAGHEAGRPMRPHFSAPLPAEEELVQSALSIRAQRERKEAKERKREQTQHEHVRKRAAEAAHDMLQKLTPEALYKLQHWHPGEPAPDGFELSEKQADSQDPHKVVLPIPKAESLKSEFLHTDTHASPADEALQQQAANATATTGNEPGRVSAQSPHISLDIGHVPDEDDVEEVVDEAMESDDEDEEESE